LEAASSPPLLRFSTGRLRLEATGSTHVGMRRSQNEDTLGLLSDRHAQPTPEAGFLFAVADGMGGAQKGEVASRLAVDTLFATYYDVEPDSAPDLPPSEALKASFNAANDAVYRHGLTLESGMMGTTLVACTIVDDAAIVGNVGDSRTYLIRDGQLRQISEDHSWVAQQVREGLISEEEARHSPQRNIITRAVGHQPRVQSDYFTVQLQPGDVLLLCSDGLHGLLENDELIAVAQQPDLQQAAQEYVDLANAHGGHDNITCLLIRVLPPDQAQGAATGTDAASSTDPTVLPDTPTASTT
jgi:PPM family protein phosphatase